VDEEVVGRFPLDALRGGDFAGTLEQLLAGLQDVVIRHLGRGWPGEASVSGDRLPLPNVAVDTKRVRIYFGEGAMPSLELSSIELVDVGLESLDGELHVDRSP